MISSDLLESSSFETSHLRDETLDEFPPRSVPKSDFVTVWRKSKRKAVSLQEDRARRRIETDRSVRLDSSTGKIEEKVSEGSKEMM